MIFLAVLLQAAPAPVVPPAPYPHPSAEAVALGTGLAEAGTLAGALPMIAAKETDELVAAHPELSASEQAELRRTAAATFERGKARLFAAEGRAYAERLSLADLRVLAARSAEPAALRYRAAQPAIIAAAMGAMAGMDLKKDTLAAFCATTGKACGT